MLSASCHCQAVRLEISRKPPQLTECNCSICRRYGAWWAYYTRKSVRVCSGADRLLPYSWGSKSLEFFHCRICGCVVYHERTKKIGDATRCAVNARMIDPAEIAGLRVRKLDGAATWKYLE